MAKLLLRILSALLLLSLSSSLRFDLQSGSTKCISEDIQIHAMAVGKYSVVNPAENVALPDSHKVSVRVTSPYGNNIHHADNVETGNFAFTSAEAGDFLACFWAADHKPVQTLTIEFDWRTGVAAKDWTNVAKKGQIDIGVTREDEGECVASIVIMLSVLVLLVQTDMEGNGFTACLLYLKKFAVDMIFYGFLIGIMRIEKEQWLYHGRASLQHTPQPRKTSNEEI